MRDSKVSANFLSFWLRLWEHNLTGNINKDTVPMILLKDQNSSK